MDTIDLIVQISSVVEANLVFAWLGYVYCRPGEHNLLAAYERSELPYIYD